MVKRTLTLAQQVAVADALRLHSRTVDGAVEYAEGWDDAKVAEALGIAPEQVASVRRRLLGKLAKRDDAATEAARAIVAEMLRPFAAEIAALRERLAAVEVLAEIGEWPVNVAE